MVGGAYSDIAQDEILLSPELRKHPINQQQLQQLQQLGEPMADLMLDGLVLDDKEEEKEEECAAMHDVVPMITVTESSPQRLIRPLSFDSVVDNEDVNVLLTKMEEFDDANSSNYLSSDFEGDHSNTTDSQQSSIHRQTDDQEVICADQPQQQQQENAEVMVDEESAQDVQMSTYGQEHDMDDLHFQEDNALPEAEESEATRLGKAMIRQPTIVVEESTSRLIDIEAVISRDTTESDAAPLIAGFQSPTRSQGEASESLPDSASAAFYTPGAGTPVSMYDGGTPNGAAFYTPGAGSAATPGDEFFYTPYAAAEESHDDADDFEKRIPDNDGGEPIPEATAEEHRHGGNAVFHSAVLLLKI